MDRDPLRSARDRRFHRLGRGRTLERVRELERRHAHRHLAPARRAEREPLAPLATATRSGFETALTAPAHEAYVAAQALDASGAVIGTSKVIKG